MGTRAITLIRRRSAKRKEKCLLGGSVKSQYFYEYYVCIYHHFDGYVVNGLGEWLADFLQKFTKNLSTYVDTGILGAKLIEGLYSSSFSNIRLMCIDPLEEIFRADYSYAYIITVSYNSNHCFDNNSIMLSVFMNNNFLTARPEKFLEKYIYYETQMEENGKSFAEISYDDVEVEKDGFLSEDQLLVEFLKDEISWLRDCP
ncbi:hypothetical protein RclHR1_05750004 [Rhizophagus clarus]|uniref:Uncharacterized protein n=1 Tax=Rhizophagus clarus TaxID=94130 RepID=A0A2Z6S774_9GLOM|nr:hypothetical protein RclHR1_05750004 [Rhizophagus clarus]GES99026.1 hypothetical protein GLOIN_2v1801701 [Rhizophagus clarus]